MVQWLVELKRAGDFIRRLHDERSVNDDFESAVTRHHDLPLLTSSSVG